MTRLAGPVALVVAAAIALGGCVGASTRSVPTAVAPSPAPSTASVAPSEAPASITATQPPATISATCEVVEDGDGTVAEIRGFSFPAGLTVKAGAAISWSNGDDAPHTVTFDDGSCASGTIGAGSTLTVRYGVAGRHPFHCAIHPRMVGSLVVEG